MSDKSGTRKFLENFLMGGTAAGIAKTLVAPLE